MKLILRLAPLLFFILGTIQTLPAQDVTSFCATPPEKSEWLKAYQRSPEAYAVRSDEQQFIPLTIHLVGTDEGRGFFTGEQLADALCTLNEDFLPTNLQFFIAGDIRYISNSTYYEHTFGEGFQMMVNNNVPNTVNCYFVQDPAGACGYFSPGADAVAMRKSCSNANDHTWAHELGHFFSLPHTFVGWEGTDYDPTEDTPEFINGRRVERVDGTFCNDAADGFCDTPPDYISYRWPCSSQGLSNVQQRDPADSTFRSDGTFFMSYASDGCMNRFSEEQVSAMRANIEFQRPDLPPLAEFPDLIPDTFQMALIAPDSGAIIGHTSSVTLEWESVAGAIGYAVDFDYYLPFNNSTLNFRSLTTTTNSLTLTDLESDRTYLWRVRPIGRYDGCSSFSTQRAFTVGTFVDSEDLIADDYGISAFPQPASISEGQVTVRSQLPQRSRSTLRLINSSGQVVRNFEIEVPRGSNAITLPVNGLSAGFYIIELISDTGRWVEKLTLTQ